jgi:hypothetical protein
MGQATLIRQLLGLGTSVTFVFLGFAMAADLRVFSGDLRLLLTLARRGLEEDEGCLCFSTPIVGEENRVRNGKGFGGETKIGGV